MYNIKSHIAGYLLQLSILPYNICISFKKVKDYIKDKREYRTSAATRCCLSLSHAEAEGGGGVWLTWELKVLGLLKGGGGRKRFPPVKRGCTKSFTLS